MWSRVRGTRLGVGQIRGGPCSHARREAAPDGGQQSGCPATGQPLCRCSISRRSPSIVITRPAATCVGDGTRIFVRGGSGSRLQQGAASAAPTWARAILDVDGRAAPSSRTARRAPERPRAASTGTRVPPWADRGFGGRRPRCPQLEDGRGQRRSASRISSPSGAAPSLARAAATVARATAGDEPSVVSAARASSSIDRDVGIGIGNRLDLFRTSTAAAPTWARGSGQPQPSPAEPSRAEPSRAQPSRAEPSPAQPGVTNHESSA